MKSFAMSIGISEVKINPPQSTSHSGNTKITKLVEQQHSTLASKVKQKIDSSRQPTTYAINNSTAEYNLIGEITSIHAGENSTHKISNTDYYSTGFEMNMAIVCQLIDNKTKQVVGEFVAYGSSGDVKLSKDPNTAINPNYNLLINQLTDDAASQVAYKLAEIGPNLRVKPESAPVVSDVKIFK